MATTPANPKVLRFGLFEFEPRTGELRKQGMRVRLAGQPIAILAMLLDRPGDLVTREELQKKLWPADTFVDFEHSLNTAIKRLRAALNDSAGTPRYVETLAGRGYRFIGDVNGAPSLSAATDVTSTVPTARRYGRWYVVLLGVFLAAVIARWGWRAWRNQNANADRVPMIRSLAVLPLENLSGDASQEYFADGMTDELITNLAQISTLKVISRTSAMHYKATKKSLPEISSELHVDGVVEGSVVRVGDRVRITAQLIDAQTDHHLWAAKYERDLRDVLALQDEVARDIAGEIHAKLTARERERLINSRPIDPEAYQLYLKGLYHWNKRSEEGNQMSMEDFQAAIEKDPTYAPAYAGLADTYTASAMFGWSPSREVIPKAKAAALKALEIDDGLAAAHASLGIVSFQYESDWAAAERHFERAVTLNPASPNVHFFYSVYLSALGRTDQAETEAKRQLDLDPVSPVATFQRGIQLYRARRFDEAIEQGEAALKLDPNFPLGYWLLGNSHLRKGMPREAVSEFEKYVALSRGSARALGYLGHGLARSGDRGKAARVISQLRTLSKQRYVSAFYVALVYVGLGENDQAVSWLEKACDERSGQVAFLKVEAEWDPLRADPRFANLVRRIGLPP